jgi:hypothetical protein
VIVSAWWGREQLKGLTTLLAERHARHLAERAQTLQDARKPMHTDPSTIWVICYQRTTQEPFPSLLAAFHARRVGALSDLTVKARRRVDFDPATSVPLASEDSQIGVRMRVCLYGQVRTYPGSS